MRRGDGRALHYLDESGGEDGLAWDGMGWDEHGMGWLILGLAGKFDDTELI